MSTKYAFGQTVTDGLILYLDAADKNSYISGSTTWYDLSGNNRHFTVADATAVTHSAAGYITINNTLGGASFSGPASNTFGFTSTSEHYLEIWAKPVLSGGFTFIMRATVTDTPNNNKRAIAPSIGYNNNNQYYDVNGCCGTNQRVNYSDSTATGVWSCWGFRNRANTTPRREIFRNTISKVNSGANTTATATWDQTDTVSIGEQTWKGDIAAILLYNRPLSDSEILQNYNARRKRFGLS